MSMIVQNLDGRYESMRFVMHQLCLVLERHGEDIVFLNDTDKSLRTVEPGPDGECFMCHSKKAYKTTPPFCMPCYCYIYRNTPDTAPAGKEESAPVSADVTNFAPAAQASSEIVE